MTTAQQVTEDLRRQATPARAKTNAWFFKTGPGQYGEGDVFIGVTVPQIRTIAKRFRDVPLPQIERLLQAKEHEFRLCALIMLVNRFAKADETERRVLHESYLRNIARVNNWDLVDTSAEYLMGEYLTDQPKKLLTTFARSKNIWERRIAIIATFSYIKKKDPMETFRIAVMLLSDTHDLIHKAVGWMLREVGKRCGQSVEEAFLKKHYRTMPRTMLRYAIERFDPEVRRRYLKGTI